MSLDPNMRRQIFREVLNDLQDEIRKWGGKDRLIQALKANDTGEPELGEEGHTLRNPVELPPDDGSDMVVEPVSADPFRDDVEGTHPEPDGDEDAQGNEPPNPHQGYRQRRYF